MEFTREDHDRIAGIESDVKSLAVGLQALDRLFVEARTADRHALEIAGAAQQEALGLARREMAGEFAKVNEFRGALSDAQANMMPRAEVTLLIGNLSASLDEVKTAQTALLGQVIEMRSSGVGRDSGEADSSLAQYRFRAVILSTVAAFIALAGVVVAAVSVATR